MNCEIVLADITRLEDAAILFDQYRQFYKQTSDISVARCFLSERMKNNESIIYLAIDPAQKKAVGFMQLYPSFSSISIQKLWILNDLFVLPEMRNQGIGKMLIEAAMALVKQRKDKGLSLSTATDNFNAQKLYHSLNFKQDSEFLHYFWKCQDT